MGWMNEQPTNSKVGGEIDWKHGLEIELIFFFVGKITTKMDISSLTSSARRRDL